MQRRTALSNLVAGIVLLCGTGPVTAQDTWPSKTIKIIAPVQPGGGVDLVARLIADRLGRALGQSIIVDNISGGGGIIASQATARAAADGYTLMVGYVGTHGTNPALRKLPYDAVKDFTPIAMVGGTPNIMVVRPPTMSRIAGAPPRYGTCKISTPASRLNNSPDRCCEVPLPEEA